MRIRVASCKPADPQKGHGEEVTISIDASNWENACRAIVQANEINPAGYSLMEAKIIKRGNKGGRRCQLHLVMRHTDRRINAVCNGDWPDVMFVEGRIASGLKKLREGRALS